MNIQIQRVVMGFHLLMTILIVNIVAAHADLASDRQVTKLWAEHFIEQNDLKKAIQHLNSYLAKHSEDPEILRLLGITYRMSGSWEKAEIALRRSSLKLKGVERASVLYLAADSQIRSGNVSGGIQTLEEVASIPGFAGSAKKAWESARSGITLPPLSLDEVAAAKALGSSRTIASTQSDLAPHPLNIAISLSSGYDSNVLLLLDSQTAGLNPATSMITPALQFNYSTSLGSVDLKSNLSASYTTNFNSAASSFDNSPILLGFEWGLPGRWAKAHNLALTQQGSAIFVNTNSMSLFSTAVGAGIKGTVVEANGHLLEAAIPVVYNWYPGVAVTSTTDDRTGFGILPSLSHRQSFLGIPIYQSLSYFHQFAKGQNFVSNNYSASIGALAELPAQVSANFVFGVSITRYPLNTSGRADNKWNLSVEFSRKFKAFVPLNGSISYGMENNSSTITSASYFKHLGFLKVVYEIQ